MKKKASLFSPIKKTRVYEEIVTKIKEMIEKGKLTSGDQLPVERELAEIFRVSRSSVREALRSLESQGFLESRQGDGTYIASNPVESLVRPLATVIFSEKDEQMELLEMRRLIEPQIAYFAAERATEKEIDMMEKTLELQEREVAKGEFGMDVDKKFHYIMAKATKNKIILRVMDNIMDLLSETRDRYLQVEGRPLKSVGRHRKILGAIKARDRSRAQALMLEHLEDIEKSLFAANGKKRGTSARRKERGKSADIVG